MPDADCTSGGSEAVPPDSELVIGLVGALGVDLGAVGANLRGQLADFGYQGHYLHLAEAFDAFQWSDPLVNDPYDERLWSYMDAGNELRRTWGRNDAMALLAMNQIGLAREGVTGDVATPGDRVAYILRSLKRPEEIKLLRDVYGSRFILIGVVSPKADRVEHLMRKIQQSRVRPHRRNPVHSPEKLIDRDENEEGVPYGQNVQDTFHRADCFVEVGDDLHSQVRRLFDVLFGDPKRSPRIDEYGAFQAAAAARRSADLGRQVGAAICTKRGEVVAVGVNEVPRAGGGLYWEGDPDDGREITKQTDTSRVQRNLIAAAIAEKLRPLLQRNVDMTEVVDQIEASPFGDILEFVRAVHAEMAALTDAARRGVPVHECTMFVTTFPCHHCARHIVAAGIERVVYVAPYAKSRAMELHSDSIVLGRRSLGDSRVPFEPFVGIGPRRYLQWFDYGRRKSEDGTLRDYEPYRAQARLQDRDPEELRSDRIPYLDREHRAAALLKACEENSGFEMQRPSP